MSTVLYEQRDRIVTLTVNRPEAMNSVDPETQAALIEAWTRFRDDDGAWVAILTGAGDKAFSAGADLKRAGTTPTGSALACDLRIASQNATFRLTEVRWAIMPGAGGTQRLPRAVPLAKALEMILMAKAITAQEALQYGLVNAVVPLPELLPTARQWAETICERGPLAVRAAKEAVIRGLSLPLADGLRLEAFLSGTLRGTEDAVEGPKAFAEKRKPRFKAR